MQIILIAVLAAGLGFIAGNKLNRMNRFRSQPQSFKGQQLGGRFNNRPVAGEIIKADGKSITVKQNDGSSRIVILSDSTKLVETSETTTDKLIIGSAVSVFGQENSDGSVTAQNIQLNPIFRGQGN